jgi:hypothetical protein
MNAQILWRRTGRTESRVVRRSVSAGDDIDPGASPRDDSQVTPTADLEAPPEDAFMVVSRPMTKASSWPTRMAAIID